MHTAAAGKRPGRFRHFRAPLAWLAASTMLATLLVTMLSGAAASGAAASVSFVQGTTFDTGKLTSTTVSLAKPVAAGDLLVGWFAQYASSGQVQVSDKVNGAWTRASSSEKFGSQGDIALYYLAGSKAAAGGITITVSAATATYLQGTVAEYSGVAASGPLAGMAVSRGTSTAVNTGATGSMPAGQLIYAAEVTGVSPGAVPTPGSSAGIAYTERASTSSGSAFEEDITSGAAGAAGRHRHPGQEHRLVRGSRRLHPRLHHPQPNRPPRPAPARRPPRPAQPDAHHDQPQPDAHHDQPSPTPTTTSPSPTPTTTSPSPTPTTTSPPSPSPSPTPTTTSPSPSPPTRPGLRHPGRSATCRATGSPPRR